MSATSENNKTKIVFLNPSKKEKNTKPVVTSLGIKFNLLRKKTWTDTNS